MKSTTPYWKKKTLFKSIEIMVQSSLHIEGPQAGGLI